MKVLLVASECVPYAKTGGLADVAGALPAALRRLGFDVRIFMPRYRGIEVGSARPVVSSLPIPLQTRTVHGKVYESRTPDDVPIYFLDQPKYYDRPELYVENGRDYPDNAERFIFFARAAVEFIRKGGFVPDVVHGNDWFSGLVPVYLRALYSGDPTLARIATVFSVHNLAYQGIFWHYDMQLTGLSWSLFHYSKLEFYGKINFMKGGLVFADKVSTVSRQYAREIRTKEFGCGLESVLEQRAADLVGIVNGVDYAHWAPDHGKFLAAPYTAADPSGKAVCKRDLQALNNLPQSDVPVIGMISRLAEQKGFDLVEKILPDILTDGAQFVLLGSGEERWQKVFRDFARRYPLQVGVNLTFSDELAHKIEAGSDLFLMPSRFEPCGLNQLYSLRYGTPPVVRAVGGLVDTIREWDPATGEGTGFLFQDYTPESCLDAVRKALSAWKDRASWRRLMQNGMTEDWSWDRSAREYATLYESAIANRRV